MASLGMYIYKDENCTEYDNISSGNNNYDNNDVLWYILYVVYKIMYNQVW